MQGQPWEAWGQLSVPFLTGSAAGHWANAQDKVIFFFIHLYLLFRCEGVSYFILCNTFLKILLHNSPQKATQNFYFLNWSLNR